MRTDRVSLRAWLAIVLVGSAVSLFIGISIERGATTPSTPAAVASQPAEGGGGEAGEAGHSAAPVASAGAPSGESGAEGHTEWRPLGIDLESPLFVGAGILASLVLALAVLAMTSQLVPLAVVGFALVFAVFDLLEVFHQVDVAQPNLVAIAIVLLVIQRRSVARPPSADEWARPAPCTLECGGRISASQRPPAHETLDRVGRGDPTRSGKERMMS